MLQSVNISLGRNEGTNCKSQFQIDFPTFLFVCFCLRFKGTSLCFMYQTLLNTMALNDSHVRLTPY